MTTQPMKFGLKKISEKIKDVYDFHDYEVAPEKLKRLTSLIYQKKTNITEHQIDQFFDMVLKGEFGILYKQPTCLTYMFDQFIKSHPQGIAITMKEFDGPI